MRIHLRLPLALAVSFALWSCDRSECRRFSDGANTYCVPSAQVLGSVLGLPASSDEDGIPFFIGKSMSDPHRLVVAISTEEFLRANNAFEITVGKAPTCRPVASNPAVSRCFADRSFGKSVYSVIYYSNRPGGLERARSDVEKALARWST